MLISFLIWFYPKASNKMCRTYGNFFQGHSGFRVEAKSVPPPPPVKISGVTTKLTSDSLIISSIRLKMQNVTIQYIYRITLIFIIPGKCKLVSLFVRSAFQSKNLILPWNCHVLRVSGRLYILNLCG